MRVHIQHYAEVAVEIRTSALYAAAKAEIDQDTAAKMRDIRRRINDRDERRYLREDCADGYCA